MASALEEEPEEEGEDGAEAPVWACKTGSGAVSDKI